jgi:glycosyltransferase involved in cell wall biosynthesis
MRIGIHNEPASSLGGSECMVAMIAAALRDSHAVEIVHHHPDLTLSALSAFSGAPLDHATLRYVDTKRPALSSTRLPWRMYAESRDFFAELSSPYDLFITVTHGIPPFCHAPIGVLFVLFPIGNRSEIWPMTADDDAGSLRRQLRARYHDWEWSRRMGSFQTKLAISEFTSRWARTYWDIDCDVLYPPVDTGFAIAAKANAIVSVGRFAKMKKHEVMLQAFAALGDARSDGWRYCCVGGLGPSAADQSYFESLRELSARCGADLLENVSRERLVAMYEQAKIFWHAAGYGEDEDRQPIKAEHFGLVTVEAMSAGAVPVVANRGGQREIVEHGVSGYLWDTLDDLVSYSRRLMTDERLRSEMSAAARRRAAYFSRGRFADRFSRLIATRIGSEKA